jgi:hypothetical protein
MAKFIMSIGDEAFKLLGLEAKNRDVTVQQLLRAVIVPDWIKQNLDDHGTMGQGAIRGSIYGPELRRNNSNSMLLSPVNRLRD